MTLLSWMQSHAAILVIVGGATVNVCTRLMASDAWSDEEQKFPRLAAAIRMLAEALPDVIGAFSELEQMTKKPEPVVPPAQPANDNPEGPKNAA